MYFLKEHSGQWKGVPSYFLKKKMYAQHCHYHAKYSLHKKAHRVFNYPSTGLSLWDAIFTIRQSLCYIIGLYSVNSLWHRLVMAFGVYYIG